MKIRRQISVGFIIIASILFLTSLIAIFEYSRMRRSVTTLMNANIHSISTSRKLMELTDEYNFILLSRVLIDSTINTEEILYDKRFQEYISTIRNNFTTNSERAIADSLSEAYSRYLSVIGASHDVINLGQEAKNEWYEEELTPVYKDLRKYKKELGSLTQAALLQNTEELQQGYYRGIMPGLVAVGVGIVLVILFNYFINSLFVTPLQKIHKGIKNYREYRKSYNVELEGEGDMQDLNLEIRQIIEEAKKRREE